MSLHLIAVGKKMPEWVQTAYQEWQKRLPPLWQFKLTEVAPAKKGTPTDLIPHLEAKEIAAHLPKGTYRICLDLNGRSYPSEAFASQLQTWRQSNDKLCFIIGGAFGLSPELVESCDACLSLSKMTLSHPLCRVILAEQIYRSWTIWHNHPYHK